MILFICDHSALNHDSSGGRVVCPHSADSAEFLYILISLYERGWGWPHFGSGCGVVNGLSIPTSVTSDTTKSLVAGGL